MEKMKKYTIYRTTESSIELEGKSLKDIESQIEEIDGDDEAWVYNDETFDVVAGMKECSFCYKTKPSNEIILTYDKKSFRCKWKNECEGLANNEDAKITKAYYDEVRMFEDIKRYLENLDSYEDSANDLKNYIDKVVECVKAKKKPFIEEIEDDDSSYTRMWLGRV
jgi:hypothetical protein